MAEETWQLSPFQKRAVEQLRVASAEHPHPPTGGPGRVTLTLSASERLIALAMAEARHRMSRASSTLDRRQGPQSPELIDAAGAAGEIAAAIYINRWPFTGDRKDPGFDLGYKNAKGILKRVQVRSTFYPEGQLISRPWSREGLSDIVILAVVQWPAVHLVGWATDHELLSPQRLGADSRWPKSYSMPQSDLHSMHLLDAALESSGLPPWL